MNTVPRNLFLCTNVTDAAWATGMANGVRESILSEAAVVEEGGEEDVASAMATLSVKVRVMLYGAKSVPHQSYLHLVNLRCSWMLLTLMVLRRCGHGQLGRTASSGRPWISNPIGLNCSDWHFPDVHVRVTLL